MIDHDRLFKELLTNFFPEFMELFFPEISAEWERDSIEFLPQEVFTDVTQGEKKIIDLLVKASLRNQDGLFIIHTEHQSYIQPDFNQRMYVYFARLYEKYALPIYPIVIYSHDTPRTPEPDSFCLEFAGWKILEFNYRVIQLNNLYWRDFVNQHNPVASALIAKMRKSQSERPIAKLAALQLVTNLGLNPAQVQLLSGFIDTYLELTTEEETVFQEQLATIEPKQEEEVMEIVTSWMREGIEQGRKREAVSFVLRQLKRRFGVLTSQLEERIQALSVEELEDLGEALLDFTDIADVETWLEQR